jgi:phosphorylase kinase alpha/beta subunit
MKHNETSIRLEKHYKMIEDIILSRQDPITGLLPASTSINLHGDYTDAWVRDNVYSILSVWGLALAYKKWEPDHVRTLILSQSVVKLMRGLLSAMMRQAHKVETFKKTLDPSDALHAKYNTQTALRVVDDDAWGHLQLDATSLFLLQLAQMSASGLRIVYTVDEVNFIQNLVHYISRTYCTADYGIWERGNKINHGTTEINCSSVGMAKAALEALNEFNLFGNHHGNEGVIHVVANDIARSRFTLHGMLPRESNSKETDAALLSIIGYPAYAIEDKELVQTTYETIIDKLAGEYGCKRFLLDGHQSSIEDPSKLHYEPSELKAFKHIESEWPLFFTYLLLDAHLLGDKAAVDKWQQKLEPLFVEHNGQRLLPELYSVPKESVEAERTHPGSQKREPNENLPLVWAQSLYMLSALINDGLLQAGDIDPLRRREKIGHTRATVPMCAIIAQNAKVKQELLDQGILSETLEEIAPIKIMYSDELSKVHTVVGQNDKLGLSGKPLVEMRTITTSFLYRLAGEEIIFLPYYFNPKGFYFSYDNRLLVKHFESSLKFLANHWDQPGQPLITFFVREDMLIEKDRAVIINLLNRLQEADSQAIKVKQGFIAQLKHTAARERIDELRHLKLSDLLSESKTLSYLEPQEQMGYTLSSEKLLQLERSDNATLIQVIHEHKNRLKTAIALTLAYERLGREYRMQMGSEELSLYEIAQIHYKQAALHHDWAVVRRLAELTDKNDARLEDALLEIIVRQKQLAVGRAYDEQATFSNPHDTLAIIDKINTYCGHNTAENILTQEIILHLGHIMRSEPELFDGILTLRTWYYVQLLVGEISIDRALSMGEAYEYLISLSPHDIYSALQTTLRSFVAKVEQLDALETITAKGIGELKMVSEVSLQEQPDEMENWLEWRKRVGLIGHVGEKIQQDVWMILKRCRGLVIGDKYNIASRIGIEDTLESTPGERQFELLVDSKLQRVAAPEYKQLNSELIATLAEFLKQNSDIRVEDDLICDVVIGYAVRLSWCHGHDAQRYDEEKGKAWDAFYRLSPKNVHEAYIEALIYLLKGEAS